MRRSLVLLLTLCLLLSAMPSHAEVLSKDEKDEKYQEAIEIMADYLETPGADLPLEPAVKLLTEIGNYSFAKHLLAYAKILQLIDAEDFDNYLFGIYFETIRASAFTAYLKDLSQQYPVFDSPEILSDYRSGRAAEHAGDFETALSYYEKCGGFFDSVNRSIRIYGRTDGQGHIHTWKEATCTAPRTCTECGATEGSALGHSWKEATCTTPKTCAVCGTTEGSALGHSWKKATCTTPKTCAVCGTTEGSALGHAWKKADCTHPKICTVCGTTEGSALGHKWIPATETAPETCAICRQTRGEPNYSGWKVTLSAFNNYKDNFETIRISVPHSGDYLHFYFDISGGRSGETVDLTHEIITKDYSFRSDWAWENCRSGDSKGAEWSKGYNYAEGDMTIRIYIKGTDICLGSFCIKLT